MLGPNQRSTKRSRSRPFNSYVVTVTFKTENGYDALTVHISVLRQPPKPRSKRKSFGVTGGHGKRGRPKGVVPPATPGERMRKLRSRRALEGMDFVTSPLSDQRIFRHELHMTRSVYFVTDAP